MERELLITGIGGQGVQLAAQVLARAATLEGREPPPGLDVAFWVINRAGRRA